MLFFEYVAIFVFFFLKIILKKIKNISKMNALKNQICLNLCQFEYFSLADFLSVGSRKEAIRKSKRNQEVEPIK